MDINDFKGLRKFKIIIPTLYICGWICMIFGPVYFPQAYQTFCLCMIGYGGLKMCVLISIMTVITIRTTKMFNKIQRENKLKDSNQLSMNQ